MVRAREATLVFQVVEQLDQVPLEGVGSALAVLQVVLAEVSVEVAYVQDGEVPVDPVRLSSTRPGSCPGRRS